MHAETGSGLDAGRAARVPPADRVSARRDPRHRGCTCRLPRFVTDRLSPIALAVPIPWGDPPNEFVKSIRRPIGPNHDRAVLYRHIDGITGVDVGFEPDRLRQP